MNVFGGRVESSRFETVLLRSSRVVCFAAGTGRIEAVVAGVVAPLAWSVLRTRQRHGESLYVQRAVQSAVARRASFLMVG